MTAEEYSAADIEIIEFDAHVRRRPAMYFDLPRDHPGLATRVLCRILTHALHPAPRLAPDHTSRVLAEIRGDLAFAVTDDLADALDDGPGRPRFGYYGTLLGPDRWTSGAAAALGARTVVEVWRDGHGVRQELSGIRPAGELRSFDPPAGAGTRVALTLDPGYFAPRSAITTDLAGLDLHGRYCEAPPGPGSVTLRDLRDGREFRYR
ncbi:hypothetical protein [Streptomyces olivochromogenes]|uniref:hypothetical protein n=1 Tax=Streptomyces olivochromogenes TaxID=1963 RepID=UPI001F1DC035|nr:hypothetical protein [Streptomyces olivochromogenes]MCF3133601.1 hypothetical protein [Streptomyces olivochromogenes]